VTAGYDGQPILPVTEATVVPVPSTGSRKIALPEIATESLEQEEEITAVVLAPVHSVTPAHLPAPVHEPEITTVTVERRGWLLP